MPTHGNADTKGMWGALLMVAVIWLLYVVGGWLGRIELGQTRANSKSPPREILAISIDIREVGECPAPIGFDGKCEWNRQLINWRGRVLRVLPSSYDLGGYCGPYSIYPDVPVGVNVLSKDSGKVLVYLSRFSSQVLMPTKIVVE